MKKSKRVLTVVIAILMLTSLFAVTASADMMWPFGADWYTTPVSDTKATVKVTLSYIDAGTEYSSEYDGEYFREEFSGLKPAVAVVKDGALSQLVAIPAPGASKDTASCTVTLDGAGVYELGVVASSPAFKLGMPFSENLIANTVIANRLGMYVSPTAGPTVTLGGAGAETPGYEIFLEYTGILEGYLGDAGILYSDNLIEAVNDRPELAENLSSITWGFQNTMAENGYEGLESFVAEYENGKFLELCIYLLSYDPDSDPYETIVFDDVPDNAWYVDYVYIAAEMGLVKGKGNNAFAPEDNMTIAEAITLAVRIHALFNGFEAPEDGEASWYAPYLEYAAEVGIPHSYPDYNAKVTREEYIHIFYAAVPEEEHISFNSVADGAIPDVPMTHKYASEIYTFYRDGILMGNDAMGTFYPLTNIRRCEVATAVCRIMDPGMREEQTLG